MTKVVWCVSDKIQGHTNQTLGVVAALAKLYTLNVQWVTMNEPNVVIQAALNTWLKAREGLAPEWLAKKLWEGELPSTNRPDYVISSGQLTSSINAWLGVMYQAKNILCGRPVQLSEALFSAVIIQQAALTKHDDENVIPVEIMPSALERVKALASRVSSDVKPTWALLFGGNTSNGLVKYTISEVSVLASHMNAIAKQQSVNWSVATSRRAQVLQERALSSILSEEYLQEVYWWSTQKLQASEVLLSLMRSCDVAVVTAESITMINEALACHNRVIAVRPKKFEASNENANILAALVNNKRIFLVDIRELSKAARYIDTLLPIDYSVVDDLSEKIAQHPNLHVYCSI